MSLPWLRLYVSLLDNPRVQRLSGDVFKVWINALCLTRRNDGILPGVADVAFALRLPEDETRTALQELERNGLVTNSDGEFAIKDWERWQPDSDSSAERTRRYRGKLKAMHGENAPPTDVETSRSRHGDAIDKTRKDTDKDNNTHAREDFPLTANAAGEFFAVGGDFLERLVGAARVARPHVTDKALAVAVRATYDATQRSAGRWLTTVPLYLTEHRESAKCCPLCEQWGIPGMRYVLNENDERVLVKCECGGRLTDER